MPAPTSPTIPQPSVLSNYLADIYTGQVTIELLCTYSLKRAMVEINRATGFLWTAQRARTLAELLLPAGPVTVPSYVWPEIADQLVNWSEIAARLNAECAAERESRTETEQA